MGNTKNFLENYECKGNTLKIVKFPHTVLAQKAQEVTVFDDSLVELCRDMLFTMYHAPGVGLAAPQVGKSIRLFVMDAEFEREKVIMPDDSEVYRLSNFHPQVLINPILKDMEGSIIGQEGCLSVPGIQEDVERYEKLTVEYQDMFGEHHVMEASEYLAIVIQHEYDHLDGLVFLDRLNFFKKKMLKKQLMKKGKKA